LLERLRALVLARRGAGARLHPPPPPPAPVPPPESDDQRDERRRSEAAREFDELLRLGHGVYFPTDSSGHRRSVARMRAEREDGER
jgi:hypothetical protein